MTILFVLLWLVIGGISVTYWWTDTNPLEVQDVLIIGLASMLGMFAFVIFALPLLLDKQWPKWFGSEKVLIKARDKRTTRPIRGRYENYNDDEWPGERDALAEPDIDAHVTFQIEQAEAAEGIYFGVQE